jgi:hypothetical protein
VLTATLLSTSRRCRLCERRYRASSLILRRVRLGATTYPASLTLTGPSTEGPHHVRRVPIAPSGRFSAAMNVRYSAERSARASPTGDAGGHTRGSATYVAAGFDRLRDAEHDHAGYST